MNPYISIITVTYNAALVLPALINSIRAQTDQGFEWVVMDGESNDGTVQLLRSISDLPLIWRSEPDFGIYDALNKAVRTARGEYYLVVGADDILESTAIANFKQLGVKSGAEILTAAVSYGGSLGILRKPRGPSWLTGQMAYVTGHSVGAAFKKSLHEKKLVGFYSSDLPICADQLFIKRAIQSGACVVVGEFIAGQFGRNGVSTVNVAGVLSEFFRVQLQTESFRGLQVMLFILRLLKNFPKLVK